jgi:hypothetical protein
MAMLLDPYTPEKEDNQLKIPAEKHCRGEADDEAENLRIEDSSHLKQIRS